MVTKKQITKTIAFLILCLVFNSCGNGYKQIKDSKPDYILDAKIFRSEYDANTIAANSKYEGKIIEVNGQISDIDNSMVILFGTVWCEFDKNQLASLIEIQKYRRITIKGIYVKSVWSIPLLKNCVVIQYFP